MNVTVENLAPCKKLLRIEVDAETVDAAFEEKTEEFKRHARLPGFRAGKVPRHMITKSFAKEIENEVRRKLIPDAYEKAVKEQDLHVITQPEIEEIQVGKGIPLQFAATVETAPDFELPEYKGIPVEVEMSAVTEEDMERALTILREQHANYQDVQRPAQEGDYAVIHYTGSCEGKPITDFDPVATGLTEQKNFWVQIGPNSFIPGFTEQLKGAQAGEHRTVTVDFPSDFVTEAVAGKQGVFEVDVIQVKEKVLPELNDELAKQFGVETADKLREGVYHDLEHELAHKRHTTIRNQLARHLLDRVQCELPETLVQYETRQVVYDLVLENQRRGVSKDIIEQQKDEIYNAATATAKDRVKSSLILGRISEKEGIQVTKNELGQRIAYLAEQRQMTPEQLYKQLEERNGLGDVHEQILNNKVLQFLEENARIQEIPRAAPQPEGEQGAGQS